MNIWKEHVLHDAGGDWADIAHTAASSRASSSKDEGQLVGQLHAYQNAASQIANGLECYNAGKPADGELPNSGVVEIPDDAVDADADVGQEGEDEGEGGAGGDGIDIDGGDDDGDGDSDGDGDGGGATPPTGLSAVPSPTPARQKPNTRAPDAQKAWYKTLVGEFNSGKRNLSDPKSMPHIWVDPPDAFREKR